MKIQMVDVKSQYEKIKTEVDQSIQDVINSCSFINGPAVKEFKASFEKYLNAKVVIPCANGTDALQIAMMALDLKPGDEIIVPAFTYVATAEVIALLQLKPVMVDVDPDSFNITAKIVERALTSKTKAVVPVNLYGQCSELEPIMELAKKHNFYVIEDNAQAIGSDYIFKDGKKVKSGLVGHIGSTSFYPSKNLGAFGDGGALYTNDPEIGERMRMVANHGQSRKYIHDIIGCNSRLDSIQAAILNVKLKHLDTYSEARIKVADQYDVLFANNKHLETPKRMEYSTHVFHQYTLKVKNGKRDELKNYLADFEIPSMIYYPLPLYKQSAFLPFIDGVQNLPITESLCDEVISLPIHTEMTTEMVEFVAHNVNTFFS